MTETQLISACLRQDRRAQKKLYDRFSSVMYAICIRYTHRRSDALDVLQEGFIKVFASLESFRGEGSFEGWMKRIFVTTAINYYHKMKSMGNHLVFEDELPDNCHDQADAISKMSERELMRLIAELPDGYRLVFNLYVIEGYDHEEIAKMLNIASATSRSQLVKARRWLQMKIKNQKIIAA